MKHRLAIFGLLVSGAAGAAFAALPSITVSDFELSGKYQCDATGGGNMWTFADSLSSVTNVTPDADGNPVGLLVNDPEGSVSGNGYARVVVHETCQDNEGYGCTSTAGFGVSFGKDLSRTYADPEDAANYGGRKVYDLTGLDSIDFWVKGTGPTGTDVSDTNGYWRIQLQSPLFNRNTFTDRSAWSGYTNNYGYNIPKSRLKANTWVRIAIPVDSLTLWWRSDWWPSKDLVLQYVTGVKFVGVGTYNGDLDGELKVDNLKFVGLNAMKAQNGLIPTFISGDVNSNTTWGPGLYYVMNDITVYDTLTIEPGTHVVFQGKYSINVSQTSVWDEDNEKLKYRSGALVAKGTAADSIYFTAADTTEGWGGLRFSCNYYFSLQGADTVGGDIRYASLSYGKGGEKGDNGGCLYLETASVNVANSHFSHCTASQGGAIYNSGNLKISRSKFFRNTGNDAVLSNSNGTVSISSSVFAYNTATNTDYGGDDIIYNEGGTLNILNSTFVGNSSESGNAYRITYADTIVNSIILGGVINATDTSHNFTANDGSIAFVDSANGDFRLSSTSPAVNAGTSEKVALNSLDLAGNPRVAMGTVDIGAYERENTAPVKTADFAPVLLKEDAAPYAATLGGASADLHISDYFSDADKTARDSLRIASVSSSSTKFALLWNAAAGSLTVTPAPDSNGTDTVLVTVADIDGATASAKMPIVIAPQNDAPKTVAPPILLMTDQDTTFDFSGYFTDIDAGDALTYSAVLKKNAAGALTSAANGITLTIPAAVSDTLKDTVTVTVTDNSAATASLDFPLWVVPVDQSPKLDLAFHDTTADEDAPDRVLSLNDHFSDPDANTLMTYSAASLQGMLTPSVSIAAGDTSLVLKFGANRNGTDSVVVTASDGLKSVRDTFTVVIRSINDTPTISDSIRGLVKDEDFADTVIDLSKHFSDVDGTLSYSAKASGKVAVTVKGSLLTLSSVANAFGTDSITVTATDDSAASVTEKFAISITPEDDAPVLTPIPDFAMQENTKDTLDLSQYYTEVDGQALTYSLVSVDNNTNGAIVNGNKTSIILGTSKIAIALFSGATGTNAVTVSATDGTTAVPATFNVVVSEVNAAPTRVATIPDVSGSEGGQIKMGALTQYFSDDGGVANLTFSTVSDNEKTVSVINSGSSAPTLSLNASGTARVIVTATDAAGLFAKDTLQVSVNGAPVIASTALTNATEDEKYTYTVEASDAEGSALTYSLENAPEGMTIADTVISWTPENGVLTSGEVTLRVSDGETSTTQKFTLTVTPVNDAPVIISTDKNAAGYMHWSGNEDTKGQVATGYNAANETAGLWASYDDANNGGTSSFTWPSDVEADANGNFFGPLIVAYGGIKGSFTLGDSYDYPFLGVGFNVVSKNEEAADITNWGGVCLTYTSTKAFSIELGTYNEARSTAYNNYKTAVPASATKTTMNFPWTSFKQESGWGKIVSQATALTEIAAVRLKFSGTAGTTGNFFISEVGSSGTCGGNSVSHEVATLEDTPLKLDMTDVTAMDVDNSASELSLVVFGGDNYTVSGTTITPAANYHGTLSVPVAVTDGSLESAKKILSVTVTPVNDAPVANSAVLASTTLAEEGTLTLGATEIASLFNDVDGDALTYTLSSTSKKITVDNSKKTITGAKDSTGTATITLSANDGTLSVSRTFTLTVTPVNDAPVIASVKKDTTDENVPIRLTMSILTATDVDNKASELSLVIGTNAHYTVSGDTVKPAKNYTGTLSIPVRVTDGKDTSAVDTVEIIVEGTTAIAGTGTRSSGISILSSGGTIRLNYSTAQTADVTVDFYNLSGVKVLTLREGVQNAGMHETVDEASALNPGFYVGVLELNGAPVAKTKVLIRR